MKATARNWTTVSTLLQMAERMTMHAYTVLDVFTATPLEGNPVAVFADGSGLDARTMQRTRRELNLSETVFVLPATGDGDARVRIFTPFAELPFAGHPVLGTAFALGEGSDAPGVTLETGAGSVPVALQRESGRVVFGEMDQPIPANEPFERQQELLAAIGVERAELPIEAYRNGPLHVYVALGGEDEVAAVRPVPARARGARSGPRRRDDRRQRRPFQDPELRARARGPRGSGDRLGRGTARACTWRVTGGSAGRADRDPAGAEIGRPSAPARARGGERGPRRPRGRRRAGGDRRPR